MPPGAKAGAACYQKVGIVRWLCASMNARVPLVKSRPSRWATSRILAAMFSVPRPSFICIQRYDPHGPLILTLQEVPDDGCCVRFGWIGLDICQTAPAEIAEHQVHIHIKGGD